MTGVYGCMADVLFRDFIVQSPRPGFRMGSFGFRNHRPCFPLAFPTLDLRHGTKTSVIGTLGAAFCTVIATFLIEKRYLVMRGWIIPAYNRHHPMCLACVWRSVSDQSSRHCAIAPFRLFFRRSRRDRCQSEPRV